MDHYICTGGCEGVAERPGTCQAIACPDNGKPLKVCDCADKKHQPHAETKPPREEREVE